MFIEKRPREKQSFLILFQRLFRKSLSKGKKSLPAALLALLFFTGTLLYFADLAGARPTLYWGSSGADVRLVQTKLSNWGYYKGSIDGVFGSATAEAVRAFQRKNGLVVDGLVGPSTWKALGFSAGVTTGAITVSVSSQGVSQSDNVDLLARIISGEARGEPYIGQVAVGAVILNRVQDPRFPTTIAGVIYQPGAFTAVSDGQINLPPAASARRAAIDALNGWDPTYGSVYYFNPVTATSGWIWTRNQILSIGKHIFAH